MRPDFSLKIYKKSKNCARLVMSYVANLNPSFLFSKNPVEATPQKVGRTTTLTYSHLWPHFVNQSTKVHMPESLDTYCIKPSLRRSPAVFKRTFYHRIRYAVEAIYKSIQPSCLLLPLWRVMCCGSDLSVEVFRKLYAARELQ